ncbi:uncharacterized protein [Nicotiana sylvestris]|uniref:uncharacterized protein n=1 Tax=Nicotiana sylvestris TaxID=4096 RepID=UPI00388C79DE
MSSGWFARSSTSPGASHTSLGSGHDKKRTWDYLLEDTLSFNDENVEGIEQPHNDALVISILMNKIQVKRVLVDPDSLANLIQSRVMEQVSLQDHIVPAARLLNGFNIASETTKREIIFPVNMAGTIQETKFHVIEGDMRYNALLRRPRIHRVLPSMLHQVLKFPTPEEDKTVYDKQSIAKEMFAIDEVIPVSTLTLTNGPESKEK